MSKQLVIKQRAAEQLTEAAEWYELQQPGLGVRFIESWTKTVLHIEKFPQHFQKKYKSFRAALIAGFPYIITFEEDTHEIIIYTTVHAHRKTQKRFQKK